MLSHWDSQQTETESDSGCEGCEAGNATHGDGVYREEVIPGKGIGCIATEEISPGCLVLRETPSLFLPPGGEEGSALLQRTVKAFLGMESEEQEKYLQLANMFDKRDV